MSQLFDFSHILHASAGNYQATGSPFLINSTSSTQSLSNNNTSISQPLNLQDEIDQFLPDAGPSVDPLSPSLSSETTNVNASPSMQMTGTPFGFAPFDFLFSFPVNNSATVAPASISNTATVTPVAPGSPKDSADNSKAKSTRGRKPKVLSEGEKVAQEQHRKEKNKEFAQVSREKKRKHVEELEQTNVALSERVRQLEQANASLMSRVMELSGAANFVGSIFKSAPSATSSLGVPTTASQSSSTLLGGSGSSSGSGVARRSLVSTQFAASSSSTRSIFSLFWPFNVPHHSQQLYPLTAFFRRHVFEEMTETATNSGQTLLAVHRCRFVKHVPSAINAMAYIPANDSLGVSRPLFACVRANGNIEIWDPVYWQLERTIPGIVGGGAIESIVWVLPDENEDDDEDDDDEDLQLETSKDKNKQNKKNKEKRVPLLVTGGLDGMVTLWDISTLTAVSRVESGGGAVWSVAVNELGGSFLALGCEDGAVRIIRVACDFSSGRDSTYALVRASSAASSVSLSGSRVLAVAFQPSKLKQQKPENGEKLEKTDKNLAFTVAAGSADSCIRLYGFSSTSSSNSMYSSRLISRLSVDSTPNNNTLVWSITYLPNGCLVSGDSLGAVCFWDTTSGNNAVLIKSFKAHQADVLCLVANAKGDTVFSSGVDRRVLQFRLIENTSAVSYMKAQKQKRTSPSAAASKIWVLSGDRRFHSHDVRALALCETKPIDCLVSGGIDASLIVTKTIANYPECKQIRQSTFPQKPIVSLATDNTARLVLARFDDHVKLWQLGRVAADQVEDGKSLVGRNRLDLVKNERLLADIKIKCVTNLTASAISPNGMLIAVSDLFATRLFRVSADRFPHSSTITRLKKFQSPELIPGSLAIQFSADSKTLILAGTDSIIRIIDVSNNEFSLVAAFTEHLYEHKAGKNSIGRGVKRELVDSLAISQDNQWLATADLANNIFIFNLDNLKLHTTLPHVKAMHTSIAFNSNSANLTVTLASNEILVYDVEHARLSPWSRQNSHMLPEKFLNRTDIIMGTESSSAIPNKLVVWGPEYICSIDTSVQLAKDVKSKNKRKYDGGKKTATAVNGKFMDDNNTDNENEEQDDSSKNGKQGFSMQFNYGPMMFFGLLSGGREAVVVERPILSVIEALPMSFYRRKYAT